jgi:hydrogenase expression/formation protein HypC
VSLEKAASGMAMGTVGFGGITRRVCLACVPDVGVGDYVVVHAGFAISKVDEREAGEVFGMLEEIAEASEAEAGTQEPP